MGSGTFMDCLSISSSSFDFTVLQSVSPESISSKLRFFKGHGSLHGVTSRCTCDVPRRDMEIKDRIDGS